LAAMTCACVIPFLIMPATRLLMMTDMSRY
jgi:hypothetical protein